MIMVAACVLRSVTLWAEAPSSTSSVTRPSEKVLQDADRFWAQEFRILGGQYRRPQLTWYTGQIGEVCNLEAVLVGPFYCPISQRIYLDQAFLEQLAGKAGGAGEAMLGYVVAHEVAHHVQGIIGTTALVEQARASSTPELANQTLSRMELQADCYAGLWLRSAAKRGVIKLPKDLSAALDQLASFGRERQSQLVAGQVMPDPLDQGSAAQRLKWVHRGLDSGNYSDCDTFGVEAPGDK
jgi:predicted metalloprotease